MNRNTLLAGFAIIATAVLLSGCDLYFGDGYEDDTWVRCDETGCYECNDQGQCEQISGGGQEPGGECSGNYDCAAGCYCDDGVCVEAGFCSGDADCPSGFECDDRASCVPEGSDDTCTSDADCPYGTFCDDPSGTCVDSWTCETDAECGMGYTCDDRGTCVPAPCETDADCLEGCYCDEELGECVETGVCTDSSQCPEGQECDLERNTCVPADTTDPGSCNGEILCDEAAPECPEGQTPAIKDGCYTGECIVIEDCDVPPPVTCADITDELECINTDGCSAEYTGINCTDPDGQSCTADQANCECESFTFDECVDSTPTQ